LPAQENPAVKGGIAGVKAVIENAVAAADDPIIDIDPDTGEEIARDQDNEPAHDPDDPGHLSVGDEKGMFGDLVILGHCNHLYYFIDEAGQLTEYTTTKLAKAPDVMSLFNNPDFPLSKWEANSKGSLNAARAMADLMGACKQKGIWNPDGKERGRGAWRGLDGELILHLGKEIWIGGEIKDPGLHGGFIYSSDRSMAVPAKELVEGHTLRPILEQLETWNWVRGYSSPRLLLGAIAQAMIGGALPWRSHTMIQGDTGTGKTTLMKFIFALLGGNAIKPVDATEASLSTELNKQTLPVIYDEFENSRDNRKVMGVIDLMRRSSSEGGKKMRSSANHQVYTFMTQSPFIVGMIKPPPLETADLNRMAFLQLTELDPEQTNPDFDFKDPKWATLGSQLFRRMVDGWDDFPERRKTYGEALKVMGHSDRGQDTFGTLLACADLALGDSPPDSETLTLWTQGLAPEDLIEYEDSDADYNKCIAFLMQSYPRRWQGNLHKADIGTLIQDELIKPNGTVDMVRKGLNMAGLGLNRRRKDGVYELFVPARHVALAQIFQESDWPSGWMYSLRGMPESWRRNGKGDAAPPSKGLFIEIGRIFKPEKRIKQEDKKRIEKND